MRINRLVRSGKLAELREDHGLTQTDVASAIGVHPSQVSRWESGQVRPRPGHAYALLQHRDGEAGS